MTESKTQEEVEGAVITHNPRANSNRRSPVGKERKQVQCVKQEIQFAPPRPATHDREVVSTLPSPVEQFQQLQLSFSDYKYSLRNEQKKALTRKALQQLDTLSKSYPSSPTEQATYHFEQQQGIEVMRLPSLIVGNTRERPHAEIIDNNNLNSVDGAFSPHADCSRFRATFSRKERKGEKKRYVASRGQKDLADLYPRCASVPPVKSTSNMQYNNNSNNTDEVRCSTSMGTAGRNELRTRDEGKHNQHYPPLYGAGLRALLPTAALVVGTSMASRNGKRDKKELMSMQQQNSHQSDASSSTALITRQTPQKQYYNTQLMKTNGSAMSLMQSQVNYSPTQHQTTLDVKLPQKYHSSLEGVMLHRMCQNVDVVGPSESDVTFFKVLSTTVPAEEKQIIQQSAPNREIGFKALEKAVLQREPLPSFMHRSPDLDPDLSAAMMLPNDTIKVEGALGSKKKFGFGTSDKYDDVFTRGDVEQILEVFDRNRSKHQNREGVKSRLQKRHAEEKATYERIAQQHLSDSNSDISNSIGMDVYERATAAILCIEDRPSTSLALPSIINNMSSVSNASNYGVGTNTLPALPNQRGSTPMTNKDDRSEGNDNKSVHQHALGDVNQSITNRRTPNNPQHHGVPGGVRSVTRGNGHNTSSVPTKRLLVSRHPVL